MRLLVISDIHLECGPFEFPASITDFDVAVFAGDIGQPISAAAQWLSTQREIGPLQNRPIVYVPGNHEFYGTEFKSNLAKGADAAALADVDLLVRRTVIINGVRFIGCILWTDYRLYGTPKPSMVNAGETLNDHRLIRYREETGHYSRFMPWHAAAEHRLDLTFVRHELAIPHSGPTVVVTHHAPIRIRSRRGIRAARLRLPSLLTSATSSTSFSLHSGSTVTITARMIIESGGHASSPIRLAIQTSMVIARIKVSIRAA